MRRAGDGDTGVLEGEEKLFALPVFVYCWQKGQDCLGKFLYFLCPASPSSSFSFFLFCFIPTVHAEALLPSPSCYGRCYVSCRSHDCYCVCGRCCCYCYFCFFLPFLLQVVLRRGEDCFLPGISCWGVVGNLCPLSHHQFTTISGILGLLRPHRFLSCFLFGLWSGIPTSLDKCPMSVSFLSSRMSYIALLPLHNTLTGMLRLFRASSMVSLLTPKTSWCLHLLLTGRQFSLLLPPGPRISTRAHYRKWTLRTALVSSPNVWHPFSRSF